MLRRQTIDARARLARLSARERSVFELVSDGLPNKLIAEQLHLSLRTVEAYRASVFEKLDVASIADLVRLRLIGNGEENFIP